MTLRQSIERIYMYFLPVRCLETGLRLVEIEQDGHAMKLSKISEVYDPSTAAECMFLFLFFFFILDFVLFFLCVLCIFVFIYALKNK